MGEFLWNERWHYKILEYAYLKYAVRGDTVRSIYLAFTLVWKVTVPSFYPMLIVFYLEKTIYSFLEEILSLWLLLGNLRMLFGWGEGEGRERKKKKGFLLTPKIIG